MYHLIENTTKRRFPAKADAETIECLPRRRAGESLGYDGGGDIAVILDADGKTLARYRYSIRTFGTEAYLNA